MERRTPLYDIHFRSALKMVKGGGDYMFPFAYTSPVDEHLNVRKNVGIQDLTSMGEVDLKGPGVERLLQRLMVANIYEMLPGQVKYTTMCNPDGLIIDDVTVYKFADEHFMVVTSSAPRKQTFQWIAEHASGQNAYVSDMSGSIALLSVQGPRSRDLLASVASDASSLLGLKFFRFTSNQINGTNLIISRSGYTGELGYELYVPAEEAAVLWEYLEKAGKEYGLLPYGTAAMQSLRIEKAFPLAGPDINGEQSPFEVGLHRWIDFSKREFIGREALIARQDGGLRERWVGLVLDGKTPANAGDIVYSVTDIASFRKRFMSGSEAGEQIDRESAGLQPIGRVTSSAKGHSMDKVLALAYLNVSHSFPGARVMVETAGKPSVATVVPTPFFDPAGLRLRGTTVQSMEAPAPASPTDSARPSRKK